MAGVRGGAVGLRWGWWGRRGGRLGWGGGGGDGGGSGPGGVAAAAHATRNRLHCIFAPASPPSPRLPPPSSPTRHISCSESGAGAPCTLPLVSPPPRRLWQLACVFRAAHPGRGGEEDGGGREGGEKVPRTTGAPATPSQLVRCRHWLPLPPFPPPPTRRMGRRGGACHGALAGGRRGNAVGRSPPLTRRAGRAPVRLQCAQRAATAGCGWGWEDGAWVRGGRRRGSGGVGGGGRRAIRQRPHRAHGTRADAHLPHTPCRCRAHRPAIRGC